MIWDPLERCVWGIAISFLFICGLMYLKKSKTRCNANERLLLLGFACMFFGNTITAICYFFRDLFVPGHFIGTTFYGDIDALTPLYQFFEKGAYISLYVEFIIFFFIFERIFKRTRYILTTIQLIFVILLIFSPSYAIFYQLNYISMNYCFVTSILSIRHITKWSKPEFKAISVFILLAYACYAVSYVFSHIDMKRLNIIPLFFSPLLLVLCATIMMVPIVVDPSRFKQPYKYWLGFNIFSLTYIVLLELFAIFSRASINGIISFLIYILVYSYLLFDTIRLLMPESIKSIVLEGDKEGADVLAMFTRPQTITEEEIAFNKERKICLVCKGKIGGFNFVCQECDALYCEKCARALSNLENTCWVCNAPFDKSKPVRIPEKKEESVKIEEESHKNKVRENHKS